MFLSPLSFGSERRSTDPRKGFALLITITLLAFLVLLLVSLASLTRVETQVASNNQKLAQARQNALMALNIALGQLQKYAGPDQRVTAEVNLKTPSATHPHWVGVYGNESATIDTLYDKKPGELPDGGKTLYKPVLLNWLVSGNESGTLAPETSSTNFGRITATPTGIVHTPAETTTLSGQTALTDFKIGTTDARLLVGPNTVAQSTDYVAAPLVPITAAAGSVPGLSTAATIGRYAYWIGDEGVKARVNLRDRYLQTGTAAEKAFSFITSQRNGIELADYDTSTSLGSNYDYSSGAIGRITTLKQLPFSASTTSATTHLSSAVSYRFHDLTSSSYSLLADAYASGLKKDLSTLLISGTTPADSTSLFTPVSSSDYGLPTWGQLRYFVQNTGATASVGSPSNVDYRSPVVTIFAVGFGIEKSSTGKLLIRLFPVLLLWNPYTVALSVPACEAGMVLRQTSATPAVTINLYKAATPATVAASYQLNLNTTAVGATGTANTYYRFKLAASTLPAGSSYYYTLSANGTYIPGGNTLTQAGSSEGFQNYVTYDSGVDLSTYAATDLIQLVGPTSNSTMRLEAALATPGNVTTDSERYQSIRQVGVQLRSADNNTVHVLKKSAQIGALNDLLPNFVLRVQDIMEETGALSTYTAQRQRWLLHTNPRAVLANRTTLEESRQEGSVSYAGALWSVPWFTNAAGTTYTSHYGETNSTYPFLNNSVNGSNSGRASAGNNQEANSTKGSADAKLFDVLASTDQFLSIGQLQHANLSRIDSYPSYPLGNSYPTYRLARDVTYVANQVETPTSGATGASPFYDLSWHLNRALLDKYFVSSMPAGAWDSTKPLPNARMTYYSSTGATPAESDLRSADKAAANLLVAGGFNINSTSKEAWSTLLAGTNQLGFLSAQAAAVPRFANTTVSSSVYRNSTTTANTTYQGNRELVPLTADAASTTINQTTLKATADALAASIVTEVRKRGPFLSVADFINRRIVSATDTSLVGPTGAQVEIRETGLRGALQAAIDLGQTTPVNTFDSTKDGKLSLSDASRTIGSGYTGSHLISSDDTSEPAAAYKVRSYGSPQWLTQADLLSVLGPALSARSDTFRIRAYGDVLDPVNSTATTPVVNGRVWCEAIVQRMPEYLQSTSDTPDIAGPNLTSDQNKLMGRRFKVVAFQWLTPNDI